jgi:hypothetical protein
MVSDFLKLLNRLKDTGLVINGIGEHLLAFLLSTNKLILEKVVRRTEIIEDACVSQIQPRFKT